MKKLSLLFLLSLQTSISHSVEVSGLVHANLVSSDQATSYQNNGTGILRYDDNGVNLQQGILSISQDLASGLSFKATGNIYSDGEHNLGLTQALLTYKPLTSGTQKYRVRAGFFYPEMSLENVDKGWLSPYTYTQSAINSWIGEELRTAGLEFSLINPGRLRKSPWSWELHLAAFRGNDPLGTLLSWRGWAQHDRQSLHQDRVEFASYLTVVGPRINHPSWVEPFHEIDGRTGFYIGAHLSYYQSTKIRYYYYDNNGDPLAVNTQRLYAWDTRFHSLAVQHNFNRQTRWIAQLMTGNTVMGNNWVNVDFDSWYMMLSHKMKQHRVSVRFDKFKAREDDVWPWDENNSDGKSITLAWRYNLNKFWQFGLEQHFNSNRAINRSDLAQKTRVNQQQTQAVIQYRF